MFPSLLEPTMKHHKSFSVRTNHQMINLMFCSLHGLIRLKCSHSCIFEKLCDFSARNIHFPDARFIRTEFLFCRFRQIRIAIARTQPMQAREVQRQCKTSISRHIIDRQWQYYFLMLFCPVVNY